MATNIGDKDLDKMSLSELKSLAQTLNIELSNVNITRHKLISQIRSCIASQDTCTTSLPSLMGSEKNNEVNCPTSDTDEENELDENLKFRLAMAKIKLEQQKIEAEAKLEQQKIEANLEQQRIDANKEVEIARIARPGKNSPRSDMTDEMAKYKKHLPIFSEDCLSDFFLLFEKVAADYQFPDDKLALLLRSTLVKGKALDVVLSLTEEEDNDYDLIKERILKSYAMTPERYRKSYREMKKGFDQSHVDFLRSKEKLLDQWVRSQGAENDYESFRNLILFEEFNNCIRTDIRIHLSDRGIVDLHQAARASDEYAIIHYNTKPNFNERDRTQKSQVTEQHVHKLRNNEHKVSFSSNYRRDNEGSRNKIVCQQCGKIGHTRERCWALTKKPGPVRQAMVLNYTAMSRNDNSMRDQEERTSIAGKKKVKFMKKNVSSNSGAAKKCVNFDSRVQGQKRPVRATEPTVTTRPCVLQPQSATKMETMELSRSKTTPNVRGNAMSKVIPAVVARENQDCLTVSYTDEMKDFLPFITEGIVSTEVDLNNKRRISILRDTGAGISLLLENTVKLTEATSLGRTITVKGMTEAIQAPLHRIYLDSELYTGNVIVGIWNTLPIEGISLILGNDIMGSKVSAEPVIESHEPLEDTDHSDQVMSPDVVHPTCALTRGKAREKLAKLKETNENVNPLQTGDETLHFVRTQEINGDTIAKSATPEVDLRATFYTEILNDMSPEIKADMSPRQKLIIDQTEDPILGRIREKAINEDMIENKDTCFYLQNGILMRKAKPKYKNFNDETKEMHQILTPECCKQDILRMAHDLPFAGHMGVNKTYSRILPYFYWPGLKKDVVNYCKSCHACQMVGKPNQLIPVAELKPIPAFEEPFSHIMIDCVGPLPKTKAGHQYLLTIMCSSTRFPEAIPLRTITTEKVVDALTQFFTRYGLPRVVQSDQGTNFTSTMFEQVMKKLGICHRLSSAYHPQSQGALERFHQTLKSMLRKYCFDHHDDWDKGVPYVLFATREATQESLGFSPFELVYGHTVRGPLRLLHETWITSEERVGLIPYVEQFKTRIYNAFNHVKDNLLQVQDRMKKHYNRKAKVRSFNPGDYRKVNELTKTDSYPIPRIDEVIDRGREICDKDNVVADTLSRI